MYRTIDTALWDDPKVKALPPDAKLLFVYLITNRHTHVSGIYYLPLSLQAHETGLKPARLDTLWHTLSGLAVMDTPSEVVWVKKMLDRQGPGAKNDLSAARQLATLHNCRLIADFLQFYAHRHIPYAIPHPTVVVQEQEQEQDIGIPPISPPPGGGVGVILDAPSDTLFDTWWAAYPSCDRKDGKADCRRRWHHRQLDPLADEIMAGLSRWRSSAKWCKDGGRYICQPARFLNGELWREHPVQAAAPLVFGETPEQKTARVAAAMEARHVANRGDGHLQSNPPAVSGVGTDGRADRGVAGSPTADPETGGGVGSGETPPPFSADDEPPDSGPIPSGAPDPARSYDPF